MVESGFTQTGAVADHRLPLPAQDVGAFLLRLAEDLVQHFSLDLGPLAEAVRTQAARVKGVAIPPRWLSEESAGKRVGLAEDLAKARGHALLVVGSRQPPAVHALAHALNAALGALQRTIAFSTATEERDAPTHPFTSSQDSLAPLVAALQAGTVKTLVTLGVNPVHTAPADLEFGEAMSKAERVFCLSSHVDETAFEAYWHCPQAHELESWGDGRAVDGSHAIQQPTIRPLWHGARTVLELVALAAGVRNWRGYAVVRETFRGTFGAGEQRFRSALHRGLCGDTGSPVQVTLDPARVAGALETLPARSQLSADRLELNFVPCNKLLDGRHANNIWMQELPDMLTKLVWDNALLMGTKTAEALGLKDRDVVRVGRGEHRIEEIAVAVVPGLPMWSLTVALGHGRGPKAGRYAHGDSFHGGGFDAYPARTQDALWFASDATVERLGRTYFFARTQDHHLMSGLSHQEPRAIVLSAPVDTYEKQPDFAAYDAVEMTHSDPQNPDAPAPGGPLWRPVDYSEGHKWGMTIDLSACTGCNACVVACQAENNIPCVGKRQVVRGREMYWLRIDRYFVGDDSDNPRVAMQPVACQHCEEAPCENVCPVNATVHSPEGMNDMAYNRCIGTRYCANNCPYKVRRFNYLSWHGYVNNRFANYTDVPEEQKMVYNPNVTVRMRGVMEKCSYCVQRVMEAKATAKRRAATRPNVGSLPRDEAMLAAVREKIDRGQLQSACQQVCPAGAIRFGDLNDEASEVAKLTHMDRGYRLLAELGTRPRTTFLAQIRNPNPDLEHDTGGEHQSGHQDAGHDRVDHDRADGGHG